MIERYQLASQYRSQSPSTTYQPSSSFRSPLLSNDYSPRFPSNTYDHYQRRRMTIGRARLVRTIVRTANKTSSKHHPRTLTTDDLQLQFNDLHNNLRHVQTVKVTTDTESAVLKHFIFACCPQNILHMHVEAHDTLIGGTRSFNERRMGTTPNLKENVTRKVIVHISNISYANINNTQDINGVTLSVLQPNRQHHKLYDRYTVHTDVINLSHHY